MRPAPHCKPGKGTQMPPTDLVLTLGSNPLPVVIAALHLHAREAELRVHVIHTRDVATMKDRVFELLLRRGVTRGSAIEVHHHDAVAIREMLTRHWDQLGPSPALGYAGGTKQMAAQVYAHWRARCPEGRAFYLSENGRMCFDAGGDERVDVKLTLEELLQLHFDKATPKIGSNALAFSPRLAVANRIQAYVRENGFKAWKEIFPPIYVSKRLMPFCHDGACLDWQRASTEENPAAGLYLVSWHAADDKNFADGGPFVGHDWSRVAKVAGCSGSSLDDLVKLLQTTGSPKRKRKDAATWLWGDWLEVWLAGQLLKLRDPKGSPLYSEVHQDIEVKGGPGRADFQADVVAVHGHRVVLFSCTTDEDKSMVKSKLFEAKQRVARLGGEYAHVVMVSLHDDPMAVLKEAEEDGWTGYGEVRAFGLSHVLGKEAQVMPSDKRLWTMDDALRNWAAV